MMTTKLSESGDQSKDMSIVTQQVTLSLELVDDILGFGVNLVIALSLLS